MTLTGLPRLALTVWWFRNREVIRLSTTCLTPIAPNPHPHALGVIATTPAALTIARKLVPYLSRSGDSNDSRRTSRRSAHRQNGEQGGKPRHAPLADRHSALRLSVPTAVLPHDFSSLHDPEPGMPGCLS